MPSRGALVDVTQNVGGAETTCIHSVAINRSAPLAEVVPDVDGPVLANVKSIIPRPFASAWTGNAFLDQLCELRNRGKILISKLMPVSFSLFLLPPAFSFLRFPGGRRLTPGLPGQLLSCQPPGVRRRILFHLEYEFEDRHLVQLVGFGLLSQFTIHKDRKAVNIPGLGHISRPRIEGQIGGAPASLADVDGPGPAGYLHVPL